MRVGNRARPALVCTLRLISNAEGPAHARDARRLAKRSVLCFRIERGVTNQGTGFMVERGQEQAEWTSRAVVSIRCSPSTKAGRSGVSDVLLMRWNLVAAIRSGGPGVDLSTSLTLSSADLQPGAPTARCGGGSQFRGLGQHRVSHALQVYFTLIVKGSSRILVSGLWQEYHDIYTEEKAVLSPLMISSNMNIVVRKDRKKIDKDVLGEIRLLENTPPHRRFPGN